MFLDEFLDKVPDQDWVFIDPMSIPLKYLIQLSYFFRRTGYLDIARVPGFIAEMYKLEILSGREIEHQVRMKV